MAAGARPEAGLWEKIKEQVSECYRIGDAREPRNALEAIREGFLTGMNV